MELDSHFLFCCGACTLCVQTVITISSKSGLFLPLDQKVNEAVREGITVVVAGGNDDDDACKYSPGTSPHAITVGEYHCIAVHITACQAHLYSIYMYILKDTV